MILRRIAPPIITPIDEDTFIDEIRRELSGPCRITPFLGSGVSAQSGVIMGEEFPKYLAWTVSQVLQKKWDVRKRGWPPYPSSDEKEKAHHFLLGQFINWCVSRKIEVTLSSDFACPKVTTLRAPEQGNHQQDIGARDVHLMRPLIPEILRDGHVWDKEDFLDTAKSNLKIEDIPADPNTPDSSEEYIVEAALRALSHWTRTLEFLARVCLTSDAEPRLYLETEPEISVIDGFNAHITRGKRPNLIHNMISRLARSMRTQIILTTNFDTLIEQSYRAQGEPLHMLAVSIRGGLPSHATVRAQDCVVKLHGDILETRADTSINEPPSAEDKQRFFQYLRGPAKPYKKQPGDYIPSHLLVLGYSASDARCVQMIRYTLDMAPKFKVFWACHSPRDVQRVQKMFGSYGSRVRILETERTDLFLWALYQKLNLSLPGGGYSLQFTQHVPPRSALFSESEPEFQRVVDELYELIQRRSERNVVYVDCASGTTQPLQAVFGRFKANRYQALWFELEDYRNSDDLFYNLLSLISLNLGYFQLEWINFATRRDQHGTEDNVSKRRMNKGSRKLRLELLIEKFKINPGQWVLFMYGRNGAGGCTGWVDGESYWNAAELEDLDEFLVYLSSVGFKVVYMPRGPKRFERDEERKEEFNTFLFQQGKMPTEVNLPKIKSLPHKAMDDLTESGELQAAKKIWKGKGASFVTILQRVVLEFGFSNTGADKIDAKKSSRALWLYGLTLLRQSRHPAAMISEAIFPCPWRFLNAASNDLHNEEESIHKPYDNDEFRHSLIYESDPELKDKTGRSFSWMEYLQSAGLFLRKPGGYSWMFRDARLALQTYFESPGSINLFTQPFSAKPQLYHELEGLKNVRARLHYWIGDWYLRAFYSTGHFIPLVEAVYHSVQAIVRAPEYKWIPRDKTDDAKERENMANQQFNLVWMAVCQLRKALLVGRKSLLFWCPGVDIKQCFFESDLHEVKKAVEQVTTNAGGFGCATELIKKLKPLVETVLQAEIDHLHEAVLKEAFAHGGRTSPILAGMANNQSSCEYVAPPDQAWKEVEPPSKILGGVSDKDWRQNIIAKMLNISSGKNDKDIEVHGRPVIIEAAYLDGLLRGISNEVDFEKKTKLITKLRREWLSAWSKLSGDEAVLFHMIWLISEMMYRILRRAKLEYHSETVCKLTEKDDPDGFPNEALFMIPGAGAEAMSPKGVSERWRVVSALGYQAMQMCRSLSPDYHYAECDLRVRVLTLYAVSLGYLNRFSEANRRFNEAHAIILSGMGWPDGKELSRIHIRRAEVLIWRARYQAGKAISKFIDNKKVDKDTLLKDFQMAITWLDDAWAALERGEICMGGVTHSTYWWYRLLSQKLSCYAALGTLVSLLKQNGIPFECHLVSLPFRRRIHLPTTLLSLMRDALIVGAGDLFRQLRVLEYAMIADAALNPSDERVFAKQSSSNRLFTQITHPELYKDVLRVLEYKDSDDRDEEQQELKPGKYMAQYLTKVRVLWKNCTGQDLSDPLGFKD